VHADAQPSADMKQLTQAIMDKVQQLQSAAPVSETNKPSELKSAGPTDDANDSRPEKIVEMQISGARPRYLDKEPSYQIYAGV
jgi:hypothetical protein